MGLTSDIPLPVRTNERNSCKQTASQDTPRPRRPSKSTSKPDRGNETVDHVHSDSAIDHLVNVSFNSSDSSRSGPTPKRAKHRRSFKIPTMHTPRTQKGGMAIKSRSRMISSPSRKILAESSRGNQSPNRRHTTVGFVLADDENDHDGKTDKERRGYLYSLAQGSFDMDGLFTSTPFTPRISQGRVLRRDELEEDTTTEL